MIQVDEISPVDNSIVTFQIHDLLRDVAIKKAKENNFMTVVCANGDGKQDICGARRLAVHNFDSNQEWTKCASPNLRTLLCFDSELPDCSRHKLMKVLYVPHSYMLFKYDIKRIEKLSLLCYLKIYQPPSATNQEYLDKLVGRMKFLQTLDIQFSIDPCQMPDYIWHIETLRHIVISEDTNVSLLGHPQPIVLQNLQTLIGGPIKSLGTTNLPTVPNLRRLQITISTDFPLRHVVAFLHTLKNLVVLKIEAEAGDDDIIIPTELLEMKDYPFYQHLTILSYKGRISFHENITFQTTMFPLHLTMLAFENFELRQDHICVLEKLPALKALGLEDAYVDEKMKCSAGGFPSLEYLKFSHLGELEILEIEEGAMPKLKELSVEYCYNIQTPFGMQHLTALRKLTWSWSGDGEDTELIEDMCKHVPSITFEHPDIYFQMKAVESLWN